jgi:hypothetical protein
MAFVKGASQLQLKPIKTPGRGFSFQEICLSRVKENNPMSMALQVPGKISDDLLNAANFLIPRKNK